MKYLMLIIFSLTTISACKTGEFVKIKPKQRIDWTAFSPDCQRFVKEVVRKRWKAHKSGDCYYEDKELYNLLMKNGDCFKGMAFTDVKNIFGEPNSIENYVIGYYMGKQCDKYHKYLTVFFVGEKDGDIVNSLFFDQVRSY
jgi:hypothetical protein